MKVKHRLLKRQLDRYLTLKPGAVPEDLEAFLHAVDAAYEGLDTDREMIASTLAISSREVRERTEELQAVFAAIPDLVLRVDARRVIVTHKPGTDETLVLPLGDVTGMPLKAALPDRMATPILGAIQAAGSTEAVTVECSRDFEGEAVFYEARIVPIGTDQHIVLVRNNTDQHLAREALQHAAAAAEAANKAKSHFLASMSHELRTPLNAIIGYSEILEEELESFEDASLLQDIQRIHSSGRHLLELVSDILDLSKIEAGRMEVHATEFDVRDLVDDISSTVAPSISRNENRLDVRVPSDIGSMRSDIMRVKQVLLNLLSNAAKFTEKGEIRLEVCPRDGNRELSFVVTDTGIGMTPAQMSRLFMAFTQVGDDPSRKYGGTGLGLVLCRRFCEMMGGDVGISSEPNVGTTATVVLPRQMP